MQQQKPVAVVAGAGPGTGTALARRFANAGYDVAMLARDGARAAELAHGLEGAVGYACDVTDPASVAATFAAIHSELGAVSALLFNAGSGVFKSVEEITLAEFEAAWRVNAYGALLCSQAVIPGMKARGAGSIVFTGATASLRGAKSTAAFAPAKAAQRSLAESMARALWPAGIHVALMVVDGVIDLPATRKAMQGKDDDFFVDPMGLAETAYYLVHQDRRAWTFETVVRPYRENW